MQMTTGAKPRALIIDDQLGIASLIEQALSRNGWQSKVLDDPMKLEGTLGPGFDLVICDLRMPGRDGLDVLRYLREHEPRLAERFILMTGNPFELAGRGEETTGIILLLKPFSLTELLDAVQKMTRPD